MKEDNTKDVNEDEKFNNDVETECDEDSPQLSD